MRFAPPQRLCPENTTCWSGSKQFTEYPAECIQWDSESETARGKYIFKFKCLQLFNLANLYGVKSYPIVATSTCSILSL